MRKAIAVSGSAIFFILAPGTVAGLAPWWISRWHFEPRFAGYIVFRFLGLLLMVAALAVLLDSFGRFALQGLGTPAPALPTRHLVVSGLFRYVRNPMYVAVVSLILGQALLLGDGHLLIYAAVVWLTTHVFVRLYEEPTLRQQFGSQYEEFCANVPRWFPRLKPWKSEREVKR